MRRILFPALAALVLGACEDESRLLSPDVEGPAASLTPGVACQGLGGAQLLDCQALVALYNGTNGPGWVDDTGWGMPDHCSWFGVTCSDDALPRVTELRLPENGLQGPVPPAIGDLSALEWLNLASNALVRPLPAQLFSLGSLVGLEIYNTGMGGPFPTDVTRLTGLEYLNLSANAFTGPIPPGLGSLSNLVSLTLSGNQLSGEVPAALANLSRLNGLRLGNNLLNGPLPDLSGLTSLFVLGLGSNPIGGPIPTWLADMSELRDLSIMNTGMEGPIPPQLGGLAQLRHIYLSYNPLSGGIPVEFGALSNLATLHAIAAGLTGPIPAELGDLTNLTQLFLNDNSLDGTLPESLANLEKLTLLWAFNNDLSGPVPLAVAELGAALGPSCIMDRNDLYLPDTDAYRNLTDPPGQPICRLAFVNQPPIADAGDNQLVLEGGLVTLDASGSSDPESAALSYAWDPGDGSGIITSGNPIVTHRYGDNGDYTATVTVSDGSLQDTDEVTIFVVNVTPVLDIPAGGLTPDPLQLGTPFELLLSFSDPGLLDTHVAEIDWGDGTVSPAVVSFSDVSGEGTLAASRVYAEPGLYTVDVMLTDDDGDFDDATAAQVVVYDPSGGFVTGAGRFDSPPGAYLWDHTASGPAMFGFQSKYTGGAQAPTGNAGFHFKAGDLDFKSDSYDWLVVNQGGTNAQFKGSGEINGKLAPNGEPFRFMIWATDGVPDEFVIRIWYEDGATEEPVYYGGSSIGPQGAGQGRIQVQK